MGSGTDYRITIHYRTGGVSTALARPVTSDDQPVRHLLADGDGRGRRPTRLAAHGHITGARARTRADRPGPLHAPGGIRDAWSQPFRLAHRAGRRSVGDRTLGARRLRNHRGTAARRAAGRAHNSHAVRAAGWTVLVGWARAGASGAMVVGQGVLVGAQAFIGVGTLVGVTIGLDVAAGWAAGAPQPASSRQRVSSRVGRSPIPHLDLVARIGLALERLRFPLCLPKRDRHHADAEQPGETVLVRLGRDGHSPFPPRDQAL